MTQETRRLLKGSMTVPQDILDEIVRRIVEVAQPDRIILFGSAARGEMGPDSDLDLLVVKAGVPHRRRLAQHWLTVSPCSIYCSDIPTLGRTI